VRHPHPLEHARRRCAAADHPTPRPGPQTRSGGFPAPRLTITCSSIGSDWVLVLRGSLDAGSVVALRSQFDQLASGEFDQVIVDVSDVVVIDHFGAAALGVLGERVAVLGAELRLRHGGCTVSGSRTLSGTGAPWPASLAAAD
jgi:ABC-type transporter Mla MlaB component